MVRVLLFVSLLLCAVNAFHMASSVSLRSAAAPVRSLPVVASAELEASIKKTTSENKIVLYSKSYCPFCVKTKVRGGRRGRQYQNGPPTPKCRPPRVVASQALLDSMDAKYTAIELDLMDGGADLQDSLLSVTGQRTVPNVFIGGKHLGGCDDTFKAFESGELAKMLA